jgi:hypothetical protein
MHYVYSTLTASNTYCDWVVGKDLNRIENSVTILGGANVINKRGITFKGAVTEVTDEEMEWLQNNDAFKQHVASGYITIRRVEINADKAARDMEERDNSAPLTPEDYAGEKEHPAVKAVKKTKKAKGNTVSFDVAE